MFSTVLNKIGSLFVKLTQPPEWKQKKQKSMGRKSRRGMQHKYAYGFLVDTGEYGEAPLQVRRNMTPYEIALYAQDSYDQRLANRYGEQVVDVFQHRWENGRHVEYAYVSEDRAFTRKTGTITPIDTTRKERPAPAVGAAVVEKETRLTAVEWRTQSIILEKAA